MSYSEEFCQGTIFVVVVCLLMLSAVMGGRNKQKSKAKKRNTPQEHDRGFPQRLTKTATTLSFICMNLFA